MWLSWMPQEFLECLFGCNQSCSLLNLKAVLYVSDVAQVGACVTVVLLVEAEDANLLLDYVRFPILKLQTRHDFTTTRLFKSATLNPRVTLNARKLLAYHNERARISGLLPSRNS